MAGRAEELRTLRTANAKDLIGSGWNRKEIVIRDIDPSEKIAIQDIDMIHLRKLKEKSVGI